MEQHTTAEPGGIQTNIGEAARFLAALDPDAKVFTFQTFDDNPDRKDRDLVKVLHGTLAQHAKTLVNLNASGAGVFVTVNETNGKGRKTENIVRVRAAFVDLDGSPLDPVTAGQPQPHVVTETSPGRWHCFWRVTEMALDRFPDTQKALAAKFHGDPKVHDLPRVMRLPGFVHRKEQPFLSRIVSVDPRPPVSAVELPTVNGQVSPEISAALRRNAGNGIVNEGPSEWRLLNDAAMRNLPAWVPSLFPTAVLNSSGAYRISSKSLGRRLQEDISISPDGIKDFGVHDMGDPRGGKRSPIDIVMEHGHKTMHEAADWLRGQIEPQPRPKTEKAEAKKEAPKDDPNIHWHGQQVKLDQRWLVKKCLPETGVAMLSGQWGIYKTFVALDLAGSVMTGEPFAGRKVARKGGVMYVAAEAASSLPIRLAALSEQRFDGERLPFAWIDSSPPLRTEGAKTLIEKARSVADKLKANFQLPLVLIIIDTLIAAANFENENDAGQGQRVMNVLHELSRATGALVVAVDHYGKDQETGTRGTSAKEGSADTILSLLGKRDPSGRVTNARMVVRKVRNEQTGIETPLRVQVVDLGKDADGEAITSCVVHWGDTGLAPLAKDKHSDAHDTVLAAAKAVGLPAQVDAVRKKFGKLYQKLKEVTAPNTLRMAWARGLKSALENGELVEKDGLLRGPELGDF